MYFRYKPANIIGQDNKWADVEIHMSNSGSTRCITAWFEMENEEYQLITKFLLSSTEFQEWPSLVNTRDKKYQLVSGNLHYMHKNTVQCASSRLQMNSQSSKLATVHPPQVIWASTKTPRTRGLLCRWLGYACSITLILQHFICRSLADILSCFRSMTSRLRLGNIPATVLFHTSTVTLETP